jgi:hypothetical protein
MIDVFGYVNLPVWRICNSSIGDEYEKVDHGSARAWRSVGCIVPIGVWDYPRE